MYFFSKYSQLLAKIPPMGGFYQACCGVVFLFFFFASLVYGTDIYGSLLWINLLAKSQGIGNIEKQNWDMTKKLESSW